MARMESLSRAITCPRVRPRNSSVAPSRPRAGVGDRYAVLAPIPSGAVRDSTRRDADQPSERVTAVDRCSTRWSCQVH